MKRLMCGIVCGLLSGSWQTGQAEVADTIIQKMFHPYAAEKPTAAGLAPGTTISQDSWEAAKDYLPPEILDKIKAGDFSFTVQETTDLPVSEAYIEATKKNAEQVKISDDGELEGYVAGLPFPVFDPADPQVGLKAAWNLRYRDFGDAMQIWNVFRLIPESGRIDREIENYYVVAYGMHRPMANGENPNKWERDGVLFKELFHIMSPFDLKNTITLRHRHARDQDNDANWLYTPSARKIRKTIVKHEDAVYDSGYLNEDAFGFWGYVRGYDWKFLGERRLLAPIGVKAAAASFGGRANWYPTDPWELRDMLVLESTPKTSNYPYGKRVLYIDRQTFVPIYTLLYDGQGQYQRIIFELYGNPKYSPGNEQVRVPVFVGESMIDYQDKMGVITTITKALYNSPLPDDFFNLDKIVARGQ